MKWYQERLASLRDAAPVYSVCGDDCAVCPRFLARTEEELHGKYALPTAFRMFRDA